LTDEGLDLAPTLWDAFGRIDRLLDQFGAGGVKEVLTVSVVGTFAVGALLPRLRAFRTAYPLIDLRLLTNNNKVDLVAEGLDYAIRFGDGAWHVNESEMIMEAPLAPLCSPALSGKGWIAFDLMDNGGAHRRSLIAVDGKVRISQRFAADWAKLGPDGLLVHGSAKENTNYYGFGEEVLAVADAVVADIKDGIPLNVATEMSAVTTLDTVAGNYVILDLGNGHFAQYAHLKPGSIRIKVGERVHAGQVLALLGNSGNSNGPHLHFQVTDGPSFLGSEGVPYVLQSFTVQGVVDPSVKGFGDTRPWSPADNVKPSQHNLEIPHNDAVVDFPKTR
jgi:hypothetical protein